MTELDFAMRQLVREAVRDALREELPGLLKSATAAPPAPNDEYLSVKRAAAMISVNPETIRSWLQQGRLKRYGHGRVLRVRAEDLHACMRGEGERREPIESPEEMAARILAGANAPCRVCSHTSRRHRGGRCTGPGCSCTRFVL